MKLDDNKSSKEGEKVTEVVYKGKNYRFSTEDLTFFPISVILGALLIFVITEGYLGPWIHYYIADEVVWLLNTSGIHTQLIYSPAAVCWQFTGDIPNPIVFTNECAGFPAFAIFIALIGFTPTSQDPIAKQGIRWRKLISIVVSCLVFHVINVFRMFIQLYIYHWNLVPWDPIHISIGTVVAIFAVIIILLMHRWIPELMISIMIMGKLLQQEIRPPPWPFSYMDKSRSPHWSTNGEIATEDLKQHVNEFHNPVSLLPPEREAMSDIEWVLGKPVPVVGKVAWDTFGFIAEGGHVTKLGLYRQELTSLPETVGNFANLQTLFLQGNQLVFLPETLGNLRYLQTLFLRDNQLASLPETLGNLTSLRRLVLLGNKLTSLPETLGNLDMLQILDLSMNKLVSLPETLGNLSALKGLYLYNNKITSLPEMLGNLVNLQSLFLRGNQLVFLPETLGKLTALKSLDLSMNKLVSLPETLGNLSELKELNLSDNKLVSLPETLGNLSKLEELYLTDNKLVSLPETLLRLEELAILYTDNNLARIPVLKTLKKRQINYGDSKTIFQVFSPTQDNIGICDSAEWES